MSVFNEGHPVDRYKGARWEGGQLPEETGAKLYRAVYGSPFGNELLEALAERAVVSEKLGQRDVTDLLAVSFSSNDAIGHAAGPDSPRFTTSRCAPTRSSASCFSFSIAR